MAFLKPFLPSPLCRPRFCIADLPSVVATSGTHRTYGPYCPVEWGGHRDTIPTDLSLPGLGDIGDNIFPYLGCAAEASSWTSVWYSNYCHEWSCLPGLLWNKKKRGFFIPNWVFWLKFVFLLRWFSCCVLWRRSGWKPKGRKIWICLKMLRLLETRRAVKNWKSVQFGGLSVNKNVSVGIQGFSATYKNHWRTPTLQPPLFHFLLVI